MLRATPGQVTPSSAFSLRIRSKLVMDYFFTQGAPTTGIEIELAVGEITFTPTHKRLPLLTQVSRRTISRSKRPRGDTP